MLLEPAYRVPSLATQLASMGLVMLFSLYPVGGEVGVGEGVAVGVEEGVGVGVGIGVGVIIGVWGG